MMDKVVPGVRVTCRDGFSYAVVWVEHYKGEYPYTVYAEAGVPMDCYTAEGKSECGEESDIVNVTLDNTEVGPVSSAEDGPVSAEAKRFNSGKTPYGNLPLDLLDGAARVMHKGETKYGRSNYRAGYSDLMSPYHSLLRHVVALQPVIEQGLYEEGGPLYDDESGEAHVHHAITSALILVQAMRKKGLKI